MKQSILFGSGVCIIAITIMMAGNLFAADSVKKDASKKQVDPRIGGIQLLPGYQHVKLQGIDSVVGKIVKEDGLSILYEIGNIPRPGGLAFGGSFSDRPKKTPIDRRSWYKEQTVNGMPMHVVYRKDKKLLVSFQNIKTRRGINFYVEAKNSEEIVEALLMLATYPASE